MSAEEEGVRFVDFRYDVPPITYVFLRDQSPVTGKITHVTFHFPAGCFGLVRVRVSLQGVPVWPIGNRWIALNDATPVFGFPSPYQSVKKNDNLDVEIENGDTGNPHMVTVLLTLLGRG